MSVNESSNAIVPEDTHCVLCNKTFSRPLDLERHFKKTIKHGGEAAKRFPCPANLCERRFTERSNLNHHLRAVHKIDPRSIKSLRKKSRSSTAKGKGKGKEASNVAKTTVSREASPVLDVPSNLDLPPDVRSLTGSSSPATPLEVADLKDGVFSFDDLSAIPDTVDSTPSYNYDFGGASTSEKSDSVLSSSMTGPSALSSSDVKEALELELVVGEYFEGYGLNSTASTPGSSNSATAHGVQYSSSAPETYDNIVAGSSSVPDQSRLNCDTKGSSSERNSELLLEIIKEVSAAYGRISNQPTNPQQSHPSPYVNHQPEPVVRVEDHLGDHLGYSPAFHKQEIQQQQYPQLLPGPFVKAEDQLVDYPLDYFPAFPEQEIQPQPYSQLLPNPFIKVEEQPNNLLFSNFFPLYPEPEIQPQPQMQMQMQMQPPLQRERDTPFINFFPQSQPQIQPQWQGTMGPCMNHYAQPQLDFQFPPQQQQPQQYRWMPPMQYNPGPVMQGQPWNYFSQSYQ